MAYAYRDTIVFHPLVRILYVVMLVAFALPILEPGRDPGEVWILFAVALILVAIPALFGRLLIEVDGETLSVRWGYLGWPKKIIPLQAIERAEVVTYKPIRQFGGWGLRSGRFQGETTACYTLRGNRGVLLTLSQKTRVCVVSTRKFLIGTQEPEKLQQALGR